MERIELYGDLGRLVGVLRTPPTPGPWPTVICCAGMTLTKEVWMPPLADALVAAGFATVSFDYATFGESDGEPRCRLAMHQQVRDVQSVLAWVQGREDLRGDRVGLFGVSLGASVAVAAGATPGIGAVVAVAGPMDLGRVWRAFPGFAAFEAKVRAARQHFVQTGESRTIRLSRLLASDPETCAKIERDAPLHPNWRPEVSFESLLDLFAFVPEAQAPHLPPTLFVAPEHDALIAGQELASAHALAPHSELLVLRDARHVAVYDANTPAFARLSERSARWFGTHLA